MSSFVTLEEARERVLVEHALVRSLLLHLVVRARDALLDERQRGSVVSSLVCLRTVIEHHLAYEETTVVPLLWDVDAWGCARAARMTEDHTGQRALLAALAEDAQDGVRSAIDLAEEIDWLARSLE